jgi:hypothetical protein
MPANAQGMRASTRAFRVLLVGSLATSGCLQLGDQPTDDQDPKSPGEVLGFFAVDGKLSDDSCGAESLSAPAKWSFEVKLSRDGSTLYWLNGHEAIVGEIDKAGAFAFETHLDLPLVPRRGAAKGCTIVRRDSASGALADNAFKGKLTYAYQATSDSDCSEFATGVDGMPEALPCKLTYSLSGAKLAE